MSLLNVTVKRAKYIGPQAAQFNTYVTLKIQNVKSTTVTVKGSDPCWEQDFLFETNSVNSGLLVEVWTKGMIWDRALGYQLIPLNTIPYSTENSQGQWYPLDMDVILTDGEVAGTKNPTGHLILIDCHFELPFDPETEPGDLQRKLEMLNGMMTHDRKQRQAQYLGNSGYSEDSDYTSDLNYPVGQNANSSASQYRNLRTPQRSLETSRENSYEKDDRSFYYECYSDNKQNMMSYSPTDYYCKDENDPLSYNSRPMNTVNYNKSIYGQSASVFRKRSLERQDTLYDEYGDTYSNKTVYQNSEEPYGFYDTNSDNLSEDRQWDSGGRGTSMNKILPKIPIKHSSSMVDSIYHRGASLPPTPPVAHKKTRLLPQPGSGGGQGASGKSLPATPRLLPQPKAAKKLSTTPTAATTITTATKRYSDNELTDFDSYSTTSQQSNISKNSPSALTSSYNIRPHTSVSAINYNEDYNYAYNSTDSLNQTFSDVIARRKGAALPTIPGINSSSKTPKIGQNANSNYTSQSFEYEKSFSDRDYYASSTTTDDYFYDNDVTNAALANSLTSSASRKSKKLPTPSSSSMSSAFSTPTLGTSGLRSGSKLPQIPPTSAQSTISNSSIAGGKILPSTPMQSNYDDDLYYTSSFPKNSYDDYATSTITTCTAPTFSTNISNFNYYTNSYDSVLTPTAAPTPVTTKSTTTMGGYYKPPSISSSIGMTTAEQQTAQQTKSTTSVLGSLTTGFKATVGGVVGGVGSVGVGSLGGGGSSSTTSSGSSATASLTSTAKSYLGLASKFLPNLTGNTTTAVSTIASAAQNTATITPTSTYGLNRNISSNTTTTATTITDKYNNITEYNTNRFDDSSNSYYTNSTLTKTSNTPIVSNNSMIYTGSTNLTGTITTPTTLTQDKNNYNTYYNDNSLDNYNTSNLQYSNQTYLENNDDFQYDNDNIDSYNLYTSTTSTTIGGVSDINDMTSQTTATSLLISSAPTTLSATTTSAAVTTSTRIGNIVDYSDDYKFGYDEYSYSENDYIATGDITDKQNYNNNYDIYDIASSSTAVDTSTTITTSSTLTSTSLYDYDYNSSYLNNKNSIYCDNSSNLITLTTTVTASIPSTTTTGASAALSGSAGQGSLNKLGGNHNNLILDKKNSSITSTTSTANNYINNIYSSSIPASTTTTNSYYMDQKSTPPTCSDVTTPTSASLTSTASTGKKLPAINGKSGVLMKQQTEIFDEDDIAASDVEQDMENDQDSYYNIDQAHHQITTATSGITTTSTTSNEYYDNTYGASDTPYYDYREDYFNEEDEYKYLEKEQQQNQLLQHQKQPPLEFIEESHDDYIDDDNVTDHSIDNAYLDSTQSLSKQQQQQQQQQQQLDDNKMKHHQLPTQETIDESSNDYMFLQKQDSIIEEEDAEPIPSPTDIYEKKDPAKSSQLQNQISCDILIPEEEPKKKTPTITRGETEEVTSGQMVRKTEVTARQRWHWAYNKIIMQLNVSSR